MAKKIDYTQLAREWVAACTDAKGNINYGMIDDAYEMIPRRLGVDLTIEQHAKLHEEVEKLLPDQEEYADLVC